MLENLLFYKFFQGCWLLGLCGPGLGDLGQPRDNPRSAPKSSKPMGFLNLTGIELEDEVQLPSIHANGVDLLSRHTSYQVCISSIIRPCQSSSMVQFTIDGIFVVGSLRDP